MEVEGWGRAREFCVSACDDAWCWCFFFERLAIGCWIFCTMQTGREAGPVDIHWSHGAERPMGWVGMCLPKAMSS